MLTKNKIEKGIRKKSNEVQLLENEKKNKIMDKSN